MKETRGFASLSSSLLARKGQARPAMRPSKGKSLEDLGWNDMGHDDDGMNGFEANEPEAFTPAPVQYQEAIEAGFALVEEVQPKKTPVVPKASKPADAPRPIEVKTALRSMRTGSRVKKRKAVDGAKAAFTLRLDTDRHLRLRLACALSNQSAQMFVTEALDALLETMPEVKELIDHVPPRAAKH